MPGHEEKELRLSEKDVEGFAGKLEQWAERLKPEEQGMLQLLLGRAEAGGATEGLGLAENEFATGTSPGETVANVLRPLLRDGATARMGMNANRQCNWSTWSRGVAP